MRSAGVAEHRNRLGRAWCGAGLCGGGSIAIGASELLVLTDTTHTETPPNPTRDEPRLSDR